MASNTPSGSIGLTLQAAGGGAQPKVLNNAEAAQLLQRLRAAGAGGPGQAIKIQAIQTNPSTGVRQIVAIPISSASAAPSGGLAGNRVSPMKVIRLPAGSSGGGGATQIVTMSPAQFSTTSGGDFAQSVKVVKIPAGSSIPGSSSPAMATNITQYRPQYVRPQAQVFTPSKEHGSSNSVGAAVADFVVAGVGGGSRKRADIDFDAFSDAKRRKTEKGGKGLRHFSMKVCEKVQAKGSTSYNEVADELVNELTDPGCSSPQDQQYDQKNIRRRVYDALNVLMAMNIINKEKKEIRWLGLPTNSVQEANGLEVDKTKRIERIKAKTQQLQDLILQQIAFKNLVERNKDREKVDGTPAPNSAIQLPFIIVNTSKETVIDCSISNDKREYLFNFDDTFEIHDDMEVLKRMGLGFGLERGNVRPEDLEKAKKMVPRALEQYVTQLAENGPGSVGPIPRVSSPKVLRELSVDRELDARVSDHDTDSEVDIN